MTRLDPLAGPGYDALIALAKAVDAHARLPEGLLELVRLRCSQINGCAYCVRLHSARPLAVGVDQLAEWRAEPALTPAERAALALAEAVTLVHIDHVPDDVLAAAIRHFGESGTQQLIWVAVVANAFNRLAISTRLG